MIACGAANQRTTSCAIAPEYSRVSNIAPLFVQFSDIIIPDSPAMPIKKNELYCGDNLVMLREHIPDESVDLIYLDPPFNSKKNFNVIFRESDGSKSTSQGLVFRDAWTWNEKSELALDELTSSPGKLSELILALKTFLGTNDIMAYLVMMAPRLQELWRVLRSTGSIYLHCDPTSSHYLKLIMDAIFCTQGGQFVNEVVWCYKSGGASKRHFSRKHDVLLFYAKSGEYTFNYQTEKSYNRGFKPYRFQGVDEYKDETGWFTLVGMKDYWNIDMVGRTSAERRGYPTQKPIALLNRIISASRNEGVVILDPFCGCGTTIAAAQHSKRRWLGIDVTHLAMAIVKQRLGEDFGVDVFKSMRVIGEPVNNDEALALARNDKFGFQCWAVGRLGAPPIEVHRGADRGIDGRIYFYDDLGAAKQIMISVKAGEHIGPAFVRELRGVVDREKAAMGILVCVKEPTSEMELEAKRAGPYKTLKGIYPKPQIITIEDIFADKPLNIPGRINPYESKRPKSVEISAQQLRLLP
jgi:site-specific DNA-methyltransferase (adenine-specific)